MSDTITVAVLCARPACRATIVRRAPRGRPPRFCDDECRRSADLELRQLRTRISHLEKHLSAARHELAMYDGSTA